MALTQINEKHDDVLEARRVLQAEAEALTSLASSLGEDFIAAVDMLLETKGRVIISGMGKSGHIGGKIAATFASTGTPAFFLHPSEASHGDLGMVMENDTVIALSHSGESRELGDLLAYCNRFGINLIAITGRENSTLAKAANIALLNQVTKEACPNNLAPTSSTTASLALADALAVALMQRKGFVAQDFARFHPGGKLGAQLKTVAEIMAKGDALPLALPDDTMDKIILTMTEKNLGGVGITSADGTLAGIITDGDLKRHMGPSFLTKPAKEVMTTNPRTISPDMLAGQAVQEMTSGRPITWMFVVDKNKPVGLLHIHHCLQAGVI